MQVRAPMIAAGIGLAAEAGALGWAGADAAWGDGSSGANIGLGMALLASMPIGLAAGSYAAVGAGSLTGTARTATRVAGIAGAGVAVAMAGFVAVQLARAAGAGTA